MGATTRTVPARTRRSPYPCSIVEVRNKTMDKRIQAPAVRRALRLRKSPANRAERGTQLVELSIVLPILLVLIGATAEFGLYYNTYLTLAKATRVGARYLSGKRSEERRVGKSVDVVQG